jgi:NTP pyrophosphatase (non-canonical NTP hydrolase)
MDNWQTRATEFAQKYHLQHEAGVHALDLCSETGEVARELLLATDYGRRSFQISPAVAAELGDVLYSLCMLATAVNVDLESAFTATLNKYENRWQARGNPGSQIHGE